MSDQEEYFIEVSIHSVIHYRVMAKDDRSAMLAAGEHFIDDWDNAGALAFGDLNFDDWDPDIQPVDRSLIATGGTSSYEIAPDDPDYEDEEDDEPTVPAGG